MDIMIKAFLQETGASDEVRRISVYTSGPGKTGIFKATVAKVGSTFPGLADKVFTLKWKDSDGDLVMVSSDEELSEALGQAQNNPLKIFVTVDGVKEVGSENVEADASQDASTNDKKEGDHQREEPTEGDFESGFCDPLSFFGMRKGGHPDSHNPRGGHFGFQFGNMGPRGHHFGHMGPRGHHFENMDPRGQFFGHMGLRGHHFGNMGPRGHHAGHMGPRGHHFDNVGPHGLFCGHMGPRGHHFGNMDPRGHFFGHMGPRGHHFSHTDPHMEMHFSFGGQDSFEGQQPFDPFHGADSYFGHPFSHHHHDRHHHHEGKGWKAGLREAVPVAHRRWAKTYIRLWRVQNLKNATSTSGDSDQEIINMESASVPEAYAAWLDIFLPKWHIRQGQNGENDNSNTEKNPEEKSKLKASVPLEFRKWTKWYLARHFGKKDAPKFHKEFPFEKKIEKRQKKDWKKSFKMQTLAASIPSEHRLWARKFIRDWQQEHKIQSTVAEGDVSSGSEAAEKKTAEGGVQVPDDYAKWMRKFLTKWHLRRGQVDGENVESENWRKGQFKDTVPKNFRKWVKCFVWRQYNNGAENVKGSTPKQYEKWLQAFQKKWIKKQMKKGCADEFVLTSSDDDAAGLLSEDAEHGVENSMKKLHLDQGSCSKAADSDNSEAENYSNWFKHALWQWDGSTAPDFTTEGSADSEQINPHLYKWMAKIMMKKQKKMMKKEFKYNMHSMKAAMKAQRYGHQF
jgi:hypothetical protein